MAPCLNSAINDIPRVRSNLNLFLTLFIPFLRRFTLSFIDNITETKCSFEEVNFS